MSEHSCVDVSVLLGSLQAAEVASRGFACQAAVSCSIQCELSQQLQTAAGWQEAISLPPNTHCGGRVFPVRLQCQRVTLKPAKDKST